MVPRTTTAVAFDVTDRDVYPGAEPVTFTARRLPTSAATGAYVTFVAPVIALPRAATGT